MKNAITEGRQRGVKKASTAEIEGQSRYQLLFKNNSLLSITISTQWSQRVLKNGRQGAIERPRAERRGR